MGALIIVGMFLMGLASGSGESKSLLNYYQLGDLGKGMALSPADYQRTINTPRNYEFYDHSSNNDELGPTNDISQADQSVEGNIETSNSFGDLHDYTHYKTSNSFNLEGPSQIESITTKSYHKEVEPSDSSFADYTPSEEHAEVHYHKHKHIHKHTHKQDHVHKHQQEHKHQHGHNHHHTGDHHHLHKSMHKHHHQQKHVHSHKGQHEHKHHHGHHHNHHGEHKHDHKHWAEHQHGHKHSHHEEHKHDHHRGHSHHRRHNHKHHHTHGRMHKHGYKYIYFMH